MPLRTGIKAIFGFVFLSLPLAVSAGAPPVIVTGKPVQFYSLSTCTLPDFTANICKQNIRLTIPHTLYSAPMANITMPSPFIPDPLTIECAQRSEDKKPRLFINTSNVSCQILQCPETSEMLCGHKLAVPAGTYLGDSVDVLVPDDILVDPSLQHKISFREQCVFRGNKAVYSLENASQISCNLFPCPDASVSLCNSRIPIKGGARIGEVLSVPMPQPFLPDTFVVQCLGDGHNPPAYKITDAAGVSCATR